ncbi:MAG: aminotransferase class V-fold PLP-dependent enzyme [Clostridiales bacterium]|jgi:cysteine desulfurase|nr:aminotransferase class V-fold PLP-dependent enzyme [Clostridiales bacterium]
MIYLDYAADTPADERVIEEFCLCQREFYANPNSTHPSGTVAAKKLFDSIERIKNFFESANEYEFIPVASASEANNLAIKGIAESYRENGRHIISTYLEHASVGGALTYLQNKGYEVELADIKRDGKIDTESLRALMRKDTILVSVCAADSELGTLQPIREIIKIVSEYPSCRVHTDAAQAVGKIPAAFFCGADCFSFAAHKFYGLNGAAFLARRKGVILSPLIHGGGSVSLYRSGTPPLALIASAAKAVELAYENLRERFEYVSKLNAYVRNCLIGIRGIKINSPADASPYILNISVEGKKGEQTKDFLGEHGICVSVKSACSVKNTPSKAVLVVTGERKRALSSIRISLSHLTDKKEADELIDTLKGYV